MIMPRREGATFTLSFEGADFFLTPTFDADGDATDAAAAMLVSKIGVDEIVIDLQNFFGTLRVTKKAAGLDPATSAAAPPSSRATAKEAPVGGGKKRPAGGDAMSTTPPKAEKEPDGTKDRGGKRRRGFNERLEDHFKELVKFHEAHGHCDVRASNPAHPTGLAMWVRNLRAAYKYRRGEYGPKEGSTSRARPIAVPPELVERLNAIGFLWEVRPNRAKAWESKFELMKKYVEVIFLPRLSILSAVSFI